MVSSPRLKPLRRSRSRRWLPVLIAGNLSVCAGWMEFSPPREFYQVSGERALVAAVQVKPASGWFSPETTEGVTWRCSEGRSVLRFNNLSGAPVRLAAKGGLASARGERTITFTRGETVLWTGRVGERPAAFAFNVDLPPGAAEIVVTEPPRPTRPSIPTREFTLTDYGAVGDGKTINMSSAGILFTTDAMLLPGRRLEISVNWPAQLNNKCALKLVARGRVVRFEGGKAAMEIQQYEFRTQAAGDTAPVQ